MCHPTCGGSSGGGGGQQPSCTAAEASCAFGMPLCCCSAPGASKPRWAGEPTFAALARSRGAWVGSSKQAGLWQWRNCQDAETVHVQAAPCGRVCPKDRAAASIDGAVSWCWSCRRLALLRATRQLGGCRQETSQEVVGAPEASAERFKRLQRCETRTPCGLPAWAWRRRRTRCPSRRRRTHRLPAAAASLQLG